MSPLKTTDRFNICSKVSLISLVFSVFLNSCGQTNYAIEPEICYSAQKRLVERWSPSFSELSSAERSEDWGKEFYIGKIFAKDMDLYRAITCFKRALLLIPTKLEDRRYEIEYEIFLAYYVGNKFSEAIEAFETSRLIYAPPSFPALKELLITLYDAYMKTGNSERGLCFLNLLYTIDPDSATGLTIETAVVNGDLSLLTTISEDHPAKENIVNFMIDYQLQAKSAKKAQIYNAILPGAGYLYVGQKKSALTSFIINALFLTASYQLFERGYIPAAIITSSLEMGWYFGGINGAALEAKEYNERLYENLGKELLIQKRLFPILMIQKGF